MVFLYPGAIHIHSIHSDGTGTIEEIAQAAKKAGLYWIIVTDHNNLDGKEGIYNGVCVIVGEEISPEDGNHYLALDIKTPISCDIPVIKYVQEVKEQGGFGFVAHPDEKEFRKNNYKSLRWSNWNMKNFGGIEIWNYLSNWGDYYNDRNLFKALYSYFFRNRVLSGPTKKILDWWDNLNNETQQIIPAIGGVDSHALNLKKAFVTIKIFPYKNTFKTITNFIHLDNQLPEDFENQKRIILEAVKLGKNLIVNKSWGGCSNPAFYIQNGYKKVYSGGSIEFEAGLKMVVKLPLKANIRIIHNGEIILQKNTKNIELNNLDKGKYRLEAYYKNRPWIFSNPILISSCNQYSKLNRDCAGPPPP